MNILGIIPARYASSRFPGKMLIDIKGKTMVQRVYEQAKQSAYLHKVIVATDHSAIYSHVKAFGGEVVMTEERHPSGTDRCHEALQSTGGSYDFVINIQGDEPFIQPAQIDTLARVLDSQVEIATLVKVIEDYRTLTDPSEINVVINTRNEAIYFTRGVIPFVRDAEPDTWLEKHTFYDHIGMYAYRSDILAKITQLPVSTLEKAEGLEQLRWIENGYRIKVAFTDSESMSVDTPEDLQRLLDSLTE
jgi:3-deoxy-manno-octulosonate cytidylyltransferase (CMP-KDO synthetase)